MAFNGTSTTNFGGNSPSGNFMPELYSKKVLIELRRSSIVDAITNSNYFGEISAYGDTVNIIKEPQITISDYTRGLDTTATALTDNELVLQIDQAKYWRFDVDDIETRMSHINWETVAADNAAYELKNDYDQQILNYMSTSSRINSNNVVNDQTEANVIDNTTPELLLNTIVDLSVRLSERDNMQEGRYLVLPHSAMRVLSRADSRLLNMDHNGGASNLMKHPDYQGMLYGFHVFVTNNAPTYTSTGSGSTTRNIILAGQMQAVATAQTILKTEKIRDPNTFADRVRGLHVYGRGVVRPESLAVAHVRFTA